MATDDRDETFPPRRDRVARIQEEWRQVRPDLDPSPQRVFGRLTRLATAIDGELDRVFRTYGLTAGEFDVLATLRRAGGDGERSPGEFAQSTMVTAGALTKRVDRLEIAGLVRRDRDPHDGRARLVGLTPEGRRLVDQAIEAHLENERRLLAALTATDQRDLERILHTWLTSLPGGG